MSMLLPVLILVILFVCMATLYAEGMWSNAVRLINVVTAALLATNYFEPLARWLDTQLPSGTYLWDFVAIWLLFCAILIVLRGLTDWVSKVKVRFLKIVDQIGSVFFSFWVSWVMICFTMMTLHTAPLARNFLFGGFQPEQRMFVFAPDRQWLGFVQKMSMGTFCRLTEQTFDPHADFMPKYATRREDLAVHANEFGTVLVGASHPP